MFLHVSKQKIPYLLWQKVVDVLCALTIAFLFVYIWNQMDQIPGLVPARFNAMGNVDSWQHKSSLYITPGIAIFVFFLMAFVKMDPRFMNMPVRVTEENAQVVFSSASRWMSGLQILITGTFVWMVLESVHIAKAKGQATALFPTYVAVGIILVFVVAMALRLRKISVTTTPAAKV